MRRKRMPIELEFKTRLSKRPDNIRKKEEIKVGKLKAQVANGKVYVGYAHFENLGKKRVIIKEVDLNLFSRNKNFKYTFKFFKESNFILTPEIFSEVYNQTIFNLRQSGVDLPKMFVVVKDGKILVVSQHFGNKTQKSKLGKYTKDSLSNKELKDLLDVWERVINAKYVPSSDMAEHFNNSFLPFDLDMQVLTRLSLTILQNKGLSNNNLKKVFAKMIYSNFSHLRKIYSKTDFNSFFSKLLSKIRDPEVVKELLILNLNDFSDL